MDFKLEKLQHENVQDQTEDLFKMIFESGKVVSPASPIKFMQWWTDGIIKVFTARDLGQLKAIKVYMVIPDALEVSKKHIIESLSVGEVDGFDEYVNTILEVFK